MRRATQRLINNLHLFFLKIDLVVPGPEQPLVDGVEASFRKGAPNLWRANFKLTLA